MFDNTHDDVPDTDIDDVVDEVETTDEDGEATEAGDDESEDEDSDDEDESEDDEDSADDEPKSKTKDKTKKTEKEEPYRPWKAKQPTTIPYDRFSTVNAELTRVRAELDSLRNTQSQTKYKTPDDIRIEDFPNDPQGYLRERDAAVARQVQDGVLTRVQHDRQQEALQLQQQQEANTYLSNLGKAIESNPEIAEASAYLDRFADRIHPSVARELTLDPNVGQLILDITTNKEAWAKLFQASPQEMIRDIHRRSALIDNAKTTTTSKSSQKGNANTRNVPPPKNVPKPVPKQIKSKSSYSVSDLETMSDAKYAKLRAQGKIR